jgi:hypothetical protein
MKEKMMTHSSIVARIFLIICIMFTSSINSLALQESGSGNTITPNIVCDEIGCILSDVFVSVRPATQLYLQKDYSGVLSGGCMCDDVPKDPLFPDLQHPCTIPDAGCAVTAFAMIVATYGGTINTPTTVNTKISSTFINGVKGTTCDYSPTEFTAAYPTLVVSVSSQNGQSIKTNDSAFDKIRPLIDSGYLVIFSGISNTGLTHYALAYGYTVNKRTYDNGTVVYYNKEIYINDPGASRFTIAVFLGKFQTIKQIHAFKKKV